MTEFVLYLACVVPVVCMTTVVFAICLLFWRIYAREERSKRDLLKSFLAVCEKPAGAAMAGIMEGTDSIEAKVEAEALHGATRTRRMAS